MIPAGYPGRIGRIDRLARGALGAVLVLFALFCPWAAAQGVDVRWVSGVVGAVLLATAAMAFCPLYRMLGLCS